MRKLIILVVLAAATQCLLPIESTADYRPLWVLEDWFDYCLEVTNRGLRTFTVSDTQAVRTYAVTVNEVLNRRPGSNGPEIVPGDSILVLARGNYLADDRQRYLLFVLYQVRHTYPDFGMPLFEGKAFPCDRFVQMFTRARPACPASRAIQVDHCACVREAAYRYRDLVAAREAGNEVEFLRKQLADENPIVLASAMGILRVLREASAMEWMAPLASHPEYQVRYDLAESIPYLAGEAAGEIGLRMLDDPEPRIQLIAAFGIGRIAYQPAESVLAEILEDPNQDRMVRATCLNALDRIGSPLLLPALEKAAAAETDSTFVRGFREHIRKQREKAAQKQQR